MAIGSINDPDGRAQLIEQMELFDADYRVQKDGSILVDASDAARLERQGLFLGEARSQPDRLTQGVLLLLLLTTAGTFLYAMRRFVLLLSRVRDAAEKETEKETMQERSDETAAVGSVSADRGLFDGEHPQTVAVYLLGLETAEAAAAMEAMEVRRREAVWERMAFSGRCDEGLRTLVSELFALKAQQLQQRPAETTEKMIAIYRRLSPPTREALLAALRRGHPKEQLITLLEAEAQHKSGSEEA